ncbi:hypothetical protein PCASD_17465 [Puccinia coronata f. sp. avenae]|uniref:Uncharacterized protein n=1 Tax=Puccinia coronata f. sp. avenae TaxID=200324 RepID=A0A2N5TSK4_9BASI|nr:hypothetical protein PCASD_17465 [Puccinia coronata f. sp. avenae]
MTLIPTRHARFSELMFPGIGSFPPSVDEELDFDDDNFFDCFINGTSASPSSPSATPTPASPASNSGVASPLTEFNTPSSSPAKLEDPPAVSLSAPPRHEIIGDVCPTNIIDGPRRPCA